MSAGNQQERLSSEEEKRWFLAGLIEGEGSCTISIKQHATAKFGFYVDPEFFIYQHKNRRAVLELAIDVFHFPVRADLSEAWLSRRVRLCDYVDESHRREGCSVPGAVHALLGAKQRLREVR